MEASETTSSHTTRRERRLTSRRLRYAWYWARRRLAFPALALVLAVLAGLALARMG